MSIQMAYILPHPPLIIPEVGKGQQKQIQKTVDGFKHAANAIAQFQPQTIIVATPHSVMYQDYIHISPGKSAKGTMSAFGAGDVAIEKAYDTAFCEALSDAAFQAGVPAGMLGERDKALDHAVLVPLYYIDRQYHDYQLVRVSASGLSLLDHYRFGQCVAQTAKALGRRAVFIASGDLSHKLSASGPYGFAAQGPEFDAQITDAMRCADFYHMLQFDENWTEAAAECGLRPIIEMAGALDGKAVQTDFLSYEGPFGVGYAVCEYRVGADDENRRFGDMYLREQQQRLAAIKDSEDAYVQLARQSLEAYVRRREKIARPDGLPEDMIRRAGVFVSLKKDGRLRGCIGTISPTKATIAEEIIGNAISAGTGDPRFEPVTEDELASLVYSVDVLGAPEPAASMAQLDAKRYGVIVTKGARRGLLLPNLEGVDTPEEQVSIALQKAGIGQNEDYTIERFEVVRHK
jgi:AmmeMemoRadiSam system protein A/AmmeMemoRadiSam system protein B